MLLLFNCAFPIGILHGQKIKLLLDFKNRATSGRWMVVNDTVMGGVSQSGFSYNHSEGYLLFKGNVSTDFGGGFASLRTGYENWEIDNAEGFVIKVKGDNKTYQFRCRLGNDFDGVAYRHYFEAKNVDWQLIRLPFSEFVPTFRGRTLEGFPVLDSNEIRRLGLMISDKQVGNFQLKIAWIMVEGYRDD